jgi:hypothetical protein
LPNPINLKSDKYRDDREVRISLSALGMGHYVLTDGSRLDFPPSLQLGFDFKSAFADGTIKQFLLAQDTDMSLLRSELDKLRIMPVEDREQSNHADH